MNDVYSYLAGANERHVERGVKNSMQQNSYTEADISIIADTKEIKSVQQLTPCFIFQL